MHGSMVDFPTTKKPMEKAICDLGTNRNVPADSIHHTVPLGARKANLH